RQRGSTRAVYDAFDQHQQRLEWRGRPRRRPARQSRRSRFAAGRQCRTAHRLRRRDADGKHEAMKRFAILAALAILPLACATHRAGQTKSTSTPGRGAIKLTITPNPVIATNVGGDTYEFPFDVVVKETGGHPVTIERVTANGFTAGGI